MRLRALPVIAFLLVILILASFGLYTFLRNNLLEATDLRLLNWADDLIVDIAQNPDNFIKDPKSFLLSKNANDYSASGVLVQFVDSDGRLLAKSPSLHKHTLPYITGEDDIVQDLELKDGTKIKVSQRKIEIEGKTIGYVMVASSISNIYSTLGRLREVLILVMVSTFVVLLFGISALFSLDMVRRQKKFLDFASHELRTPLSVISGNAEVALRDKTLSEDTAKTFLAIKEESDWMNKLVSNFLFVSRKDIGKEKINKSKFNFGELITDSASNLKKRYSNKNVIINLSDEAEISADEDKIRQVINNLLENAAKYTEPNGKITISLVAQKKSFIVSVSDNGIGIDKRLQRKIFDPFYRVDQKNNEGLGLGLAITKWIIAAHHGKIKIESAVGQGTTFFVTLPK